MALQPWRKGVVTRIENETYNTRRFWIQVPELESFDFGCTGVSLIAVVLTPVLSPLMYNSNGQIVVLPPPSR